MSYKTQLLEFQNQKAQVQALEDKLIAQRDASLATLPYQFGYPDLPSFIKAVKAACHGTRPRKRRVKKPVEQAPAPLPPIGEGLAKSLPPKPPEPKTPTGTSLDDPANFGVLPDNSLLTLDLSKDAGARERLTQALAFAGRILHTSRVPAAVWREWRQFERQGTELLKAANAVRNHVS